MPEAGAITTCENGQVILVSERSHFCSLSTAPCRDMLAHAFDETMFEAVQSSN